MQFRQQRFTTQFLHLVGDHHTFEAACSRHLVALRLDKSTLAYTLMVACLKIGAPYFFIDPANPRARVEHILEKCTPTLVFSSTEPPLDLPGPPSRDS